MTRTEERLDRALEGIETRDRTLNAILVSSVTSALGLVASIVVEVVRGGIR